MIVNAGLEIDAIAIAEIIAQTGLHGTEPGEFSAVNQSGRDTIKFDCIMV